MSPTPVHPSWCEYPYAPADSSHTHTATMGTVRFDGPTTIELVLIQAPDSPNPMLTLHIVTPAERLSVDLTGTHAWSLAGVLIDATVAHSQASFNSSRATSTPPGEMWSRQRNHVADALWLLDRHPTGRMPSARTRRLVRCLSKRWPKIDGGSSGETGFAE